MATITFDTLKYANRLISAGVSHDQAYAEAEALRDVLAEAVDTTVATRTDVHKLHSEVTTLTAQVAQFDIKTDGRFTLLQWMIGFNLAFTMAILWKIFH